MIQALNEANRTDKGTFTQKFNEPKRLRSIKLTDTAWDNLEQIAQQQHCSRTDLIEAWARGDGKQRIVLGAIDHFINLQSLTYNPNRNQFRKQFSLNTRDWRKFREFKSLVESMPSNLKTWS